MALWLCRTGRHGEHETKFIQDGRIYLTWMGLNRDLGKLKDLAELRELLDELYPKFTPSHRTQNSGQIWAFVSRMSPGDWVVVPSKQRTIHVGEITGRYVFSAEAPEPYFHSRTIKWLQTDIPRTNFDGDILNSLGAFTTVCRIQRNDAETRIRAMQANGWKSAGIQPRTPQAEDEDDAPLAAERLDLEQIARDEIARLIASRFSGHSLESLVEAILKAQGFTTHHSPKGADGGVDILAAPGTLGFGSPRICVQVKSQDSPLERPVLDQLVGTMQHVGADQGLLVCWGGFKATIEREAPRLFFRVRLWDQKVLIDELLAHYDKLDEDIRAELPLKRVWAVAAQDDGTTVAGQDG